MKVVGLLIGSALALVGSDGDGEASRTDDGHADDYTDGWTERSTAMPHPPLRHSAWEWPRAGRDVNPM